MKTPLILLVALLSIGVASAWHCTDTDQSRPNWNSTSHSYGPWGDNGLLGGTTEGWGASNTPPAGCTGTQGNYVCHDYCKNDTLVEYYCSDRPHNSGETIIFLHNYEDSAQCAPPVPEFPMAGAVIAATGAILGIVLFRRK